MALTKKYNNDIDVLLARYLSGEAAAGEKVMVEAWRNETEANRRQFDELQLIWSRVQKIIPEKKPDAYAALQKLQMRISSTPRPAVVRLHWLKVAAALVLIAGIIGVVKLVGHRSAASTTVILAAGDQSRSDTLPDGSVIELQPHGQLIYASSFDKNARTVQLIGTAFFSVSHNPNSPFEIKVNNLTVTVLGTSFKIIDTAGNTEIMVATGVVQVSKQSKSMKVFPNERLIVPATDTTWIKRMDTIDPGRAVPNKSNLTLPGTRITNHGNVAVDDYDQHRQIMRSIIDDMVKEKIAGSTQVILWMALTDSVFILNGATLPETLHQDFKTRYKIKPDEGYFFGPVKLTGKGYFFTKEELYKEKI